MKLNRKWVLVIALLVSLTMATASTLAFLTDRDSEANVFTVGNVEIDLNEEFDQDSTLMPGQDIEKIPTITNTGDNDAWVWMTIAVPAYLDNVNSAANNIVHWNWMGGTVSDTMGTAPSITQGKLDTYKENGWLDEDVTIEDIQNGKYWIGGDGSVSYVGTQEIEGAEYNVYVYKYNSILEPGEETLAGPLVKVYMDERVDIDPEGNVCLIENGVATKTDWNINDTDKPIIYVSAYAMQAEGFADVNAAYEAYNKQWGENGTEYADPNSINADVMVSTSAELAEAIKAGKTRIGLNPGTYTMTSDAQGKTLTLVGSGADETIIEVVPGGRNEALGQLDYSFDGSKVTFEDLTIKTNSKLYAGYARLSGTYNNCTIQNTYNLGVGTSKFTNCTFNITNEYLRVGGATEATFINCTFNTDGRAILVYQDGTSVDQKVTVRNCTFNATAGAKTGTGIPVSAVSIDGTSGTYVVNLEGKNVVDSDFNGLWQIKTGEANVTVNE